MPDERPNGSAGTSTGTCDGERLGNTRGGLGKQGGALARAAGWLTKPLVGSLRSDPTRFTTGTGLWVPETRPWGLTWDSAFPVWRA